MIISSATAIVIFIVYRGKIFQTIYSSVELILLLNSSFAFSKPNCDLHKFAKFA